MAHCLRSGMHGKMFGAGGYFQMLSLSLKALYKGNSQAGSQIRVLPVGLVAPAPSRIPEDVHIWRPVGQPFVDIPVAFLLKFIVFRPAFG